MLVFMTQGLVQKHKEENKIIKFASRALGATKKTYSQTEKEMLDGVHERFHTYINSK